MNGEKLDLLVSRHSLVWKIPTYGNFLYPIILAI